MTCLGLIAFAIGLGLEKREKELVTGGFDLDLLYGSPETLSSKQWSKQLKEGLLRKQTVCFIVDEAQKGKKKAISVKICPLHFRRWLHFAEGVSPVSDRTALGHL